MSERPVPASAGDSDESLAYVVLERARLCCEREAPARRAPALRLAHRHLGTAGYLASDSLEPEARRELQAAARAACEVPLAPAEDPAEEALLLARQAAEIVARCLRRPGAAERMRGVQVEVLDGLRVLVRVLGPARARALSEGGRPVVLSE